MITKTTRIGYWELKLQSSVKFQDLLITAQLVLCVITRVGCLWNPPRELIELPTSARCVPVTNPIPPQADILTALVCHVNKSSPWRFLCGVSCQLVVPQCHFHFPPEVRITSWLLHPLTSYKPTACYITQSQGFIWDIVQSEGSIGAIYQSDVTMEDHVIICNRKQSVAVPGNAVAGDLVICRCNWSRGGLVCIAVL